MQFQKLDKRLSATDKVFWQMDPVKKILSEGNVNACSKIIDPYSWTLVLSNQRLLSS